MKKLDGVQGNLRIGIGGPILKNNSDDLEVRNAGDTGQTEVIANVQPPSKIVFWHWQSIGTALTSTDGGGGTVYRTRYYLNGIGTYYLFPAFLCRGGTYRLDSVSSIISDSRAILDWLIDGDLKGQMDWYRSTTQYNQKMSITGITLSAGSHVLRGEVNGKNPSAGTPYMEVIKTWLTRTGA